MRVPCKRLWQALRSAFRCGRPERPSERSPRRQWKVTLRDGTVIEVEAINAYHAGSRVVYGPGPHRMDGHTGRVLSPVKIHRDNILDIQAIVPDPNLGTRREP